MFLQKKKFCIALLITCLFTIAFGINVVQAAPAASVGVADFSYLIDNHPDTPKANEELKTLQEQAKKDFETKSAGLGDKEKRDLALQLDQQLAQKRQELLKIISEQIVSAIKEVRAAKGLSVVVAKNIVIDGGVDITSDVQKKLTSK